MPHVEVTIVMVPRERYGAILRTIDSIYEQTDDVPFELIVVDGALPETEREALRRQSEARGFTFIHEDRPLCPNEARNIGLQHVKTPYLVFTDNDIIFTKGWLPPLLASAKEEDAWLVGPTILDGEPERGLIHAAGGRMWFEEMNGRRRYHFVPNHMQGRISEVHEQLRRAPTTMLEFHVILARRELFDQYGPLDEGFMSFADHDDLVMLAMNAGKPIIYEPASVVAYHDPGTNPSVVERRDLPYYLLRWSDEWNDASIRRAVEKWRLDPEDPWIGHAKNWVKVRRRKSYRAAGLSGRLVSFIQHRLPKRLGDRLEQWYCDAWTKRLRFLRDAASPKALSPEASSGTLIHS